jgi:hypothetical protein
LEDADSEPEEAPAPDSRTTLGCLAQLPPLRPQYSVEVLDPGIVSRIVGLKSSPGPVSNPPTASSAHSKFTHSYSSLDIASFSCNTIANEERDTFTVFPLLPVELRIQIWKLAVIPRVVAQHFIPPFNWDDAIDRPILTPLVPVMMMICKESREIALGIYEKVQLIDQYDFGTLPLLRHPV